MKRPKKSLKPLRFKQGDVVAWPNGTTGTIRQAGFPQEPYFDYLVRHHQRMKGILVTEAQMADATLLPSQTL